jgi:hypothetical protein
VSNKAQLAFCDLAIIIVQKQMKPHTVRQSFNLSACLKLVKTMLSEEVEEAVRNIQLLDDNIHRRINDASSNIAENVSKTFILVSACKLNSPNLVPQHMYWFSKL